ncbi:MAG: DUF4328 domain-containing protein [Asticcacaulis sp.]|nr:DUF4328 domain-containing protein [Asticcacaulis sp.]
MSRDENRIKRPRIATFFLLPGLVLQLASEAFLCCAIAFLGFDMSAFDDPSYSPDSIGVLVGLASLIILVMLVINFIMLMFWVYRINANTHNLPVPDLEYEPGWAVGWWLIPFANLWKPFDIMCELYNANKNPNDWHELSRPPLLIAWWVVTILQILPTIALRFANDFGGSASVPYVLLYVLGAIRLALIITIVLRINGFQKIAIVRPGVEQVF